MGASDDMLASAVTTVSIFTSATCCLLLVFPRRWRIAFLLLYFSSLSLFLFCSLFRHLSSKHLGHRAVSAFPAFIAAVKISCVVAGGKRAILSPPLLILGCRKIVEKFSCPKHFLSENFSLKMLFYRKFSVSVRRLQLPAALTRLTFFIPRRRWSWQHVRHAPLTQRSSVTFL